MTTDPASDVQQSPVKGALIRQLREALNDGKGMARHKFAAAADISPSTLQRAEDSEPGTSYGVLVRIAKVLGVPVARIYDHELVNAAAHAHTETAPAWALQMIEQLQAQLQELAAGQREILRRLP